MSGQPGVLSIVRPLLTGAAGALALVGVFSLLGASHWTLELLSHFRLFYIGTGLVLAILAAALRLRAVAALAAVTVLIQLAAAWPYVMAPSQARSASLGPTVRIFWANLNNWGTDIAALKASIEREKPDIAVFTELAASHGEALRQLRSILPFQSALPNSSSPRDLVLLSVRPPVAVEFDYSAGTGTPLLAAELCPADGFCLTLLGLHAARPVPHGAAARNLELDHAAAIARHDIERGNRVILIGDLNVTPFSPAFSHLLAASGLVDSAVAPSEKPHVPAATWIPGRKLGVGLAIDHALLGPGLDVVELRTGTPIGSDHLPLILDVRAAPKTGR